MRCAHNRWACAYYTHWRYAPPARAPRRLHGPPSLNGALVTVPVSSERAECGVRGPSVPAIPVFKREAGALRASLRPWS